MKLDVLAQPNNFACLDAEDSSLEKSAFAVLPVSFEGTVSYGKGASKGPAAILHASRNCNFSRKFE